MFFKSTPLLATLEDNSLYAWEYDSSPFCIFDSLEADDFVESFSSSPMPVHFFNLSIPLSTKEGSSFSFF